MAKCAFCNKIIVFGGRRLGEQTYCNATCLIRGRELFKIDDDADVADLRSAVREFRDALLVLAEEVEQQGVRLAEVTERLDFAERTLAQSGGSATPMKPPMP